MKTKWVLCMFVYVLVCTTTSSAAVQYTITDVSYNSPGTYGRRNEACGINDSGQVAGWSRNYGFWYNYSATLWDSATGTRGLGNLSRDMFMNEAMAYGMNEMGQVVGWSHTGPSGTQHAFLWTPGGTQGPPRNPQMQDLGTLGGTNSFGCGVNDNAHVVGSSDTATGQRHAFLYRGETMEDLGTLGGASSGAVDINNFDQVAGTAKDASGQDRAFVWRPGATDGIPSNPQMKDLGHLGGGTSAAYGMNHFGEVVGNSFTGAASHAFVWDSASGMRDLGTLGGSSSVAHGINQSGQVVGSAKTVDDRTHAFLYSNGVMRDLNDLIPTDSGWTLEVATDINNRGQIVGYGGTGAFLLSPLPPDVTPRGELHNPQAGPRYPVGFVPSSHRLKYYNSEGATWDLLFPSSFDPSKATYVLTHDGMKVDNELGDMSQLAAAIAARDPDANVVGWDWENRVSWRDRKSARRASAEQGPLLAAVLAEVGLAPENATLIGHGIGGHLLSSAASNLSGSSREKLSRLVLLDTPMFWEWAGTPGEGLMSSHLNAVEHTDNLYYGFRLGEDSYLRGKGKRIFEANVFNADLDYHLVDYGNGHQFVVPWYVEAVLEQRADVAGNTYGIRIDGVDEDVLTHQRTGSYRESELLLRGILSDSSDLLGPGLELWRFLQDLLPLPTSSTDMSSLASWSGHNATAVTVVVANRFFTEAVELTESSDAYIWKQLTIPDDAFYLSFDAIFLGDADADRLIVSFDDEILFSDNGALFNDTLWGSSGGIYIADYAGDTGILQFWLKSEGDPNLRIVIDNVAFVVPEPATIVLLAIGALTIILLPVRKKTPLARSHS